MYCMIFILLNLVSLWPRMWSILVNFLCELEKNEFWYWWMKQSIRCPLYAVGWSSLYDVHYMQSNRGAVEFFYVLFAGPSISERGIDDQINSGFISFSLYFYLIYFSWYLKVWLSAIRHIVFCKPLVLSLSLRQFREHRFSVMRECVWNHTHDDHLAPAECLNHSYSISIFK